MGPTGPPFRKQCYEPFSASPIAALSHRHEPRSVLGVEMKPQPRLQCRQTIAPEIVVEFTQSRRKSHRLDPGLSCARLQSIRTETAEKLLPNAEAWGAPTDLAALTACLTIVSIAVNDDPRYADEAHVMMSDGDAFAGHWIEVFLDEDAVVMDASLAG